MKLHLKLVVGLAVLAMGLVPAMAGAVSYQPEYKPETPKGNPGTPQGPKSAPNGHAYGYWCRGESKKHVKGEKGTAFSRCVQAHKRAANQPNLTAKQACKGLSKKHTAHGDKGTAFSRCVKTVAQQRQEEAATVLASVVA
jgi:uncharacterized membrane protein